MKYHLTYIFLWPLVHPRSILNEKDVFYLVPPKGVPHTTTVCGLTMGQLELFWPHFSRGFKPKLICISKSAGGQRVHSLDVSDQPIVI